MSLYLFFEAQHPMASPVRNNRTTELYRRSIIAPCAVLYRIIRPKPGHCSSFSLSKDRAEEKSEDCKGTKTEIVTSYEWN